MNHDFYSRRGAAILLIAAAFIPVIAWGSLRAYDRSSNQVDQWLPRHTEAAGLYDDFLRAFGSDESVLVSWEGCTLDDPRLERFARYVEGDPAAPRLAEPFATVVTGRRAFRALVSEPLRFTESDALARLEGTLVGPDRKTTCAVLTLSDAGDADRSAALATVAEIAETYCGVPAADLRLGGDVVIGVAIDSESKRAVTQWTIVPSMAIALGIAWICLGSVKLALMVFLISEYCGTLSEAMVYYSGGSMNLLLIIVPALTYVLTLSASVHLCNYHGDAIREGGLGGAALRAVRAGWQPCLLSAVTTIVGLASLSVSRILPVKMFGVYAALSVLGSFGVTMLVLPAAVEKFPARDPERRKDAAKSGLWRKWDLTGRLADFVLRRHMAVVIASLMVMAFFAVGVARIRSSVDPARFLTPQSRWTKDADWFRRHIGPLTPIEVIVGFQKDCGVSFARRVQLVRDAHRQLASLDLVGGVTSAATFTPPLDVAWSGRVGASEVTRRTVFNRALLGHRGRYVEQRYLADDGDWERWRISARVQRPDDTSYEDLLRLVRDRVNVPVAQSGIRRDRVEVYCTGAVPLILSAQEELFRALVVSFALACVLIALVMIGVLQSPLAGLVVMLPNVFPALVVFGSMGWAGAWVDVGAMMTASVALGIAVDDTVHFVTWFRRALGEGASQHEAIRHAYHRCARAMTSTTLIAGLGLLVFFFSSFQPVSRFGLLMFILLAAALVGDLLLLPGLLATPMGLRFIRQRAS
jgi:hypothetical protein